MRLVTEQIDEMRAGIITPGKAHMRTRQIMGERRRLLKRRKQNGGSIDSNV